MYKIKRNGTKQKICVWYDQVNFPAEHCERKRSVGERNIFSCDMISLQNK